MITHIVLLKLLDRSRASAERVRDALLGLEGHIPELRHIEVGIDVLRTERSYDLALVTRFDSLEALEAYQKHPVHVEVLRFISTVRESAVAVDYED